MAVPHAEVEILKSILENAGDPDALDAHPWTGRPFVRDVVALNPALHKAPPGQQLIGAVKQLFWKMLPGTPPRRGKRLDSRWAEFGILAAQYFAPLQFGTPVPTSLRDAWGRMDEVILLYVNGSNGHSPELKKADLYRLVGHESEVAPISTLSDWHRKGIERLADAIHSYERYLASAAHGDISVKPAVPASISRLPGKRAPNIQRVLFVLAALLTIGGLIFGGLKAGRIYKQARVVQADVFEIRALAASSPGLEAVKPAGESVSKLRADFDALKTESAPMLWMGKWLGWVPVYGGDLAASADLLEIADLLLQSGEKSYAALLPIVDALEAGPQMDPARLIALLEDARPELLNARQLLDQASQLRLQLDSERLSPKTQLLIEEMDRVMPLMDDGLAVAVSLPQFLGASSDGPKTYLILAQNEDELRPTGGFITAAGTLVLKDGEVLSLSFADSGQLDHWEKPYPLAPWQLDRYMNSRVLVLRDANWFTDFPTSALYAENLYAYHNSHSVDGVIAFDQQMLVLLLRALGPIEVEGAPDLIDSGNVISYMRSAKTPPPGQPIPPGWDRKAFMNKITAAILDRIFTGGDVAWAELGKVTVQALNEHHLLMKLDDPVLQDLASRHAWDGAVRSVPGDFLMVVDANIGFNKTSAVVDTQIFYDVDLTDLQRPSSQLNVVHENRAEGDVDCTQWDVSRGPDEIFYPMNTCYWNYMRVYTQAGAQLLDATVQTVPNSWMILGRGVKGHVDILDEEIEGLQAFGTLMVVPASDSLSTRMQFSLPNSVIENIPESGQRVYRLTVRKQPGTLAVPLTVRVHLPPQARIVSYPSLAFVQENSLLFETDLRTDIEISITFAE